MRNTILAIAISLVLFSGCAFSLDGLKANDGDKNLTLDHVEATEESSKQRYVGERQGVQAASKTVSGRFDAYALCHKQSCEADLSFKQEVLSYPFGRVRNALKRHQFSKIGFWSQLKNLPNKKESYGNREPVPQLSQMSQGILTLIKNSTIQVAQNYNSQVLSRGTEWEGLRHP